MSRKIKRAFVIPRLIRNENMLEYCLKKVFTKKRCFFPGSLNLGYRELFTIASHGLYSHNVREIELI